MAAPYHRRLHRFSTLALVLYFSTCVLASHHHKNEDTPQDTRQDIKEEVGEDVKSTAPPISPDTQPAMDISKEQRDHSKGNPLSVLFYSFFVSMDKSAGYAYPFSNKLCYMAQYDYKWLLDVVPKNKVPWRHNKMAPTWYKPHGIQRWLSRVDYLVYLDMDLVVKRPEVNFVQNYATGADLTVTDHNRALNNGAFVLKNSKWGRKFLQRWTSLTDSGFDFPFSDNGSFIEAILSFIPGYKKDCMKPKVNAGRYLDCASNQLKAVLSKFDGQADRIWHTEDGGTIRFVAPKNGFNSHEYNDKRPKMGWAKEACFNRESGFILHTKEWQKEVPEGSAKCAASASADGKLTTNGGEHLYGQWGSCQVSQPSCHDRLVLTSGSGARDDGGAEINGNSTSGYSTKPHHNHSKTHSGVVHKSSKHPGGLNKYLDGEKKKKRPTNTSAVNLASIIKVPAPPSMADISKYKAQTAKALKLNSSEEESEVVISKFASDVTCSLSPTSSVHKLGPNDRYGVLAIPKTATTSLTKMMTKGGLHSSCGGILWQSSEPGACPKALQTPIKLKPPSWQPTEKNGRVKKLSHVLHPDFGEVANAWKAHSNQLSGGSLKMVVVLREPVSRLFSAYTHGKNFNVRNQVSPGDRADRDKQPMRQRMDTWRSFYWSYRDYNDSTLLLTSNTHSFEEFAALPYMPTHNQQTRMLAGVRSTVIVDNDILNTAKQNLCSIECVGVLDNLDPVVECVSRQLGLSDVTHQTMPEKNLKGANSKSTITDKARQSAERNGWADLLLHRFASELVQNRHH